MPDRDISLTATRDGSTVNITGDGEANLPAKSGAHRFKFTLNDPTGLNVRFSSLDAQDAVPCPPAAGENSTQIVGMQIGPQGDTAAFTDNNNNREPMDVCYQWNFTCNDPDVRVAPFDPIIRNGGDGP